MHTYGKLARQLEHYGGIPLVNNSTTILPEQINIPTIIALAQELLVKGNTEHVTHLFGVPPVVLNSSLEGGHFFLSLWINGDG